MGTPNDELIAAFKIILDGLENRLDAKLEARLDSLKTELKSDIARVEQRLDAKIEQVNGKVKTTFNAVLDVGRDVKALKGHYDELEHRVEVLEGQVAEIKTQVDAHLGHPPTQH